MERDYDAMREALIEAPCFVIEPLLRQVPADGGGQYFAVERFYRARPQIDALYRRFAHLVLKLNCYYDFAVEGASGWEENPPPEALFARVEGCAGGGVLRVLLPGEGALLALDWDDLYMALHAPAQALLETVRPLAASEGLFVRLAAG